MLFSLNCYLLIIKEFLDITTADVPINLKEHKKSLS
jgi:hypothetical protein